MKNTSNVSHIFNKYANLYQDKYMNVDLYGETLDLFCDSIQANLAKILDIGCGPGNVTQYLLKKCSEFDVLGIDLAENMIELAQINNPHSRFQTMDCRKISQVPESFDGIMCGFCLPYLDQVEVTKLIKDASALLNKNGILYLSCMENDYANSGLQGPSSGEDEHIHMYYYQTQQLIELLNNHGFSVIKSFQLDNPQQSNPSIKDLVIIANKGVA